MECPFRMEGQKQTDELILDQPTIFFDQIQARDEFN